MVGPSSSAATSPTASGAPSAPGRPPASSRPRRLGGVVAVVVVVAVAAVALLAGLWAAGWIPGSGPASSTAVSYSTAATVAASASAGYERGGWQLIQAFGFMLHAGSSLQLPSFGPVCPMHAAPGMNGASAMFPGYGNPGAGVSPGWEMLFRNSSGTLLLVLVLNGKAQVVGDAYGSNCLLYPFTRGIPTSVLDSTAVVAAINVAGGSAFLASHSSVSSVVGLTGGTTIHAFPSPPVNATWGVMYTSCGMGPEMMGTGAAFLGWANATSGVVLNTTQTSGACMAAGTMPSMPSGAWSWPPS